MLRTRLGATALIVSVVAFSLPLAAPSVVAAHGHTANCGHVQPPAGGFAGPIHAKHVRCHVARDLAHRWLTGGCEITPKPEWCKFNIDRVKFQCKAHTSPAIIVNCLAGRHKHVRFFSD